MSPQDFTFHFSTTKKAKEIFPILLDVQQWWNGLLDENWKETAEKLEMSSLLPPVKELIFPNRNSSVW